MQPIAPISSFVHLRVHSVYSLLEGAIALKPLVKWCAKQHMPAVAVADHGNLFGSLEFAMNASEQGVQPIPACVMFFKPYVSTGSLRGSTAAPEQLLLIAQNEQGWKNLMHLSSKAYLQPTEGMAAPCLDYLDLNGYTDGLIALTGGIYGAVGRALAANKPAVAQEFLEMLNESFPGRVYIELMRHGLELEAKLEPAFLDMALHHNLPLVATNDVYFEDEDMFEAHDAFLCIAPGSFVGEVNRRRLTKHHRLKTPSEMQLLFADIPEALENTLQIAKRCSFFPRAQAPILPRFTQDGQTLSEADLLRAHARKGLANRLQAHGYADPAQYAARLEYELEMIIKMQFPGYFLIVSDFIRWSKQQGIPVGPGRGSGAGSLVAWALLITDLDPIRYGLLFERFLNPSRVSMPDFDIDFCQDRREEVIAYVQKRYGAGNVAQIITFGKLQARAALRDVGRVLQMPYMQVDKICRLVPNNPASPVTLEEALRIEPLLQAAVKEDETVAKLMDISLRLEGLNRNASTHAAGVVIADRPLQELVPLYIDPKSDMPVVQYSMKYAESAGLVKFDFLGLKTLSVLAEAVRMLRKRGVELDLQQLPEGDKATYEMMGRGETVGVFQLESAGMRDTLRKLKPDCFEDIIALVSLYRPGPMDNIPTYIARKHGQEKPDYLHPKIEPILRETFGVIIYQEQVMQIAQVLAGYSLGEADLLRRAMGKKIRAEMEAQRGIFVEKSIGQGVDGTQAAQIFDLIAKFAEYGFNKSHAAAYSLIAYQTAYIKANFPREFFAASMTYDMQNTDKLAIFREDAGRCGIRLLPPDVNVSDVKFSVEGEHIRYALAAIRNVGAGAMEALVNERQQHGPFSDLWSFLKRIGGTQLNKRPMEYLIKSGALDSLDSNRRRLAESLDLLLGYAGSCQEETASDQANLFAMSGSTAHEPRKPALVEVNDWPGMERLEQEFSALGFYLSAHPLESYRQVLSKLNLTRAIQFPDVLTSQYRSIRIAGIVTGRKFKASPKGRFAFVQISDGSSLFEVSIFQETLLNSHRDKLEPGNMLMITADAKLDEGGARLIATHISPLETVAREAQARQKDAVVVVQLMQEQAVAGLRQMLGDSQSSGARVVVECVQQAQRVQVELPGYYSLSPADLERLGTISGVLLKAS